VTPRRLLLACILSSAFATAALGTVFALLWAALAALRPGMGTPTAEATVALALASLAGLSAALVAALAMPRRRPVPGDDLGAFGARIWAGVKARPIRASVLTVLAVLLALLNPRYLGALLYAYLNEQRGRR